MCGRVSRNRVSVIDWIRHVCPEDEYLALRNYYYYIDHKNLLM